MHFCAESYVSEAPGRKLSPTEFWNLKFRKLSEENSPLASVTENHTFFIWSSGKSFFNKEWVKKFAKNSQKIRKKMSQEIRKKWVKKFGKNESKNSEKMSQKTRKKRVKKFGKDESKNESRNLQKVDQETRKR